MPLSLEHAGSMVVMPYRENFGPVVNQMMMMMIVLVLGLSWTMMREEEARDTRTLGEKEASFEFELPR